MRSTLATLLLVASAACGQDVLQLRGNNIDEFTQNTAAMVDVLWIVDNSGSMAQEQQGLGESFESFVEAFVRSGVDYHIGVISTDVGDGGVLHHGLGKPAFIDGSTDDPAGAFLANVKVGTTGSARERGFEAAALALGRGAEAWQPGDPEPTPVPNEGFLRRGLCIAGTCEGTAAPCLADADCAPSTLFLTFVSDEDDKSFGSVQYYWRLFEQYKGAGNESLVRVSAIVGPRADPAANPEGGCRNAGRGEAEPGDRYIDLVARSLGELGDGRPAQGVVASICEDFNESLTRLSMSAVGLGDTFSLSAVPDTFASLPCDAVQQSAFCVRVDGEAVPEDRGRDGAGWRYDDLGNAIVFGALMLPPPQAEITVEYRLGG